MFNEIKLYLTSAKFCLADFVLFYLAIVILSTFIINDFSILILTAAILFLLCLILLIRVRNKRKNELESVRSVITGIRNNVFKTGEEIKLHKSLFTIQNEIRQMFEKEKNDIDYLKKLERMRTEFIANVSHELRTPIFAIQGYIETLLNGAIDDEKVNKYFLEKANKNTVNLSNLLNDLIDISMIESGEMRMSFRYFDINSYLQQLVQENQPLAEEKNIELTYIPCRQGLQLFGDKVRLKQVLINLITNAIKYTEKGRVEILVEEEAKSGKIVIKDTGIGIPPEDINRIFERFYRIDKARSRSVGGTGLGLAIVKHILEAHGSGIEVKSELGAGSEFSFRLKK